MKLVAKSKLPKIKSPLVACLVTMSIAPAALAQPTLPPGTNANLVDSWRQRGTSIERTESERFFGEGREKLEREIFILRRGELSATDELLKIDENLLNQSGILSLEEHPQFEIDIRVLPQEFSE